MAMHPALKDLDNGVLSDLFAERQVDVDDAICFLMKEQDRLIRIDTNAMDDKEIAVWAKTHSQVCRALLVMNTIIRTNPSIVGRGLKIPVTALNASRKDNCRAASPIGEPKNGRYTRVPRPVDQAD